MKLSVIIPARGRGDLVQRALDSLRGQAEAREILIVDDGRGSGEALAGLDLPAQARLLENRRTAGFAGAANSGIEASSGEAVLLLNSDAVLRRGLERIAASFAARERLAAVGAELFHPDGRRQWSGGSFPTLPWCAALASGAAAWLGESPTFRRFRPVSGYRGRPIEWLSGAALALRRAALEEVGLLDESYRFYGQDLDLCSRLARRGWQVALARGFEVVHALGATVADRPGGQRTDLLWDDLLHWAATHRGQRWARRAARCMEIAGRTRLAVGRLRLAGGGQRAGEAESQLEELRAALAVARAAHGLGGRS